MQHKSQLTEKIRQPMALLLRYVKFRPDGGSNKAKIALMSDHDNDILRRAHAIRHEGIALENDGLLNEARTRYEEALSLYRVHSTADDLHYANAVRYVAAIYGRLGLTREAKELWHEALSRYEECGIKEGVEEASRHLRDG